MKKYLCLLLLFLPGMSWASGYSLTQMNAIAQGMANAYLCRVDNASAVWYNPAALTRVKNVSITGGFSWVRTDGDFNPTFDGGVIDAVPANLYPINAYAAYRISDEMVLAAGLYSPFLYTSEWPKLTQPAIINRQFQLRTLYFTPSIGYKVNPHFSVGGGLDLAFSDLDFIQDFDLRPALAATAAVDLNVDGTGFGFNLGALYESDSGWNFGAVYKNRIKIDYDGETTLSAVTGELGEIDRNVPSSTDLPMPAQLMFGASTRHEDWTFEGDVTYTFWDTLDAIRIFYGASAVLPSTQFIPRNYNNALGLHFGAEYQWSDHVNFRGGYQFDEAAAPEAAVDSLLPDISHHGISLGAGYHTGEWNVDVAYSVLFSGSRTTPFPNVNSARNLGKVAAGDYSTKGYGFIVGAGYNW